VAPQKVRTVEERVQALEDERELRDLLSRYSFNADLGRTAEYAELFTDDGVIDLRDMGLPRYEGRQAILNDFISGPAKRRAGVAFHHAAPTVFYIDGDLAEGEGYSLMFVLEEDGAVLIRNANYSHWSFARVDGEWKITERNIRLLGSPEASRIFSRTTS
jgi:hypothetical protein